MRPNACHWISLHYIWKFVRSIRGQQIDETNSMAFISLMHFIWKLVKASSEQLIRWVPQWMDGWMPIIHTQNSNSRKLIEMHVAYQHRFFSYGFVSTQKEIHLRYCVFLSKYIDEMTHHFFSTANISLDWL